MRRLIEILRALVLRLIQFADLTGSGRDDYLDVNPDGSVSAWFNGGTH